jgi:DNA-binding MarR family transcriptional regulator
VIDGVERVVVASVGLTARAVTDVAADLTLGQWRVLVLVDRPGGMAVGSIATALGAKMAAVSRLISRLQRRGLVETRRADFDARVVLVSLTSVGEALRTRIVERRRSDLVAMLEGAELTPDSQGVVERVAAALETNLA